MNTTRTRLVLGIAAFATIASLCGAAAASASSPTIESDSVSHITSTDATLEAQINTGEVETTYQFSLEYGCGISEPKPGEGTCWAISGIDVPTGELPASSEPQSVSVDLNQAGVILQPSTKYRYRVEATNATGMSESPDQTFTTSPASEPSVAGAPSVESESVSNVTSTDATLEAQIDPSGLETSYQFRLESGCPVSGLSCMAITVYPLPAGSIPASSEVQNVSLDLNNAGVTLHPGTEYRYSVEATNSAGPTVKGPDQTFTTESDPSPPATAPPSIESESASNITATDATLEAQIDPGGQETEYWFRVLASPCHADPINCELVSDPHFPSPAAKIAAASGGQSVKLDLNSAGLTLKPGTEYHYALFATNPQGTAGGPDQTFTTEGPPSIESESASTITPTDATLGAEINLHEAPAGVYYQFQLVGDLSEYASEILCPPTLQPGTDGCIGPQGSPALPIGFLPGNTLQPSATSHASLDLASAGVTLQPGTTYHYRVLTARAVQTEDTIEWEAPTVLGADQTFTTPSDPPPPSSQTGAGTSVQLPTTQSSPSSSSSHHRKHRHQRRHKRGLHRRNAHRAKRAG